MKSTPERLLTLVLVLLLTVLAGLGTVVALGHARGLEQAERALRAQHSLTLLAAMQAAVTDAESAQRAHTLTGDPVFLQRLDPAQRAAESQLVELRNLMSANAEQYSRLVALGPVLARRFEALAAAVDQRNRLGPLPVQQAEAVGDARRLQDRLRAAWLDLQTHAAADLAQAQQRSASARGWTLGALAALVVLALLGAGAALWRLRAAQVTLRRAAAERHDAAERSRRASDDVQRLFEAPLDALCLVSSEGRLLRVGAGGAALWGWGASELQGQPLVDRVAPEDRRKTERALADAVANPGAPAPLRHRFRHRDGRVLTLQWSLQASAQGGELVAVARDVTELESLRGESQRLAAALQAATADAAAARAHSEQATRRQTAFLATVAQQLRPAAAALATGGEALLHELRGREQAAAARQAGALRDRAQQLADAVADLLDLAAIEAGRLTLQREPFDLSESLQRVATLVRPQAERKGLVLRLDLADDLGYARGDARRVEQVLARLLRHAIDATPAGEVALRAGREGDGSLHVDVDDQGAGYTAEDLASLFTAWRPGDAIASPEREKAGLKLAVSQQLAQLMGGDLLVSSLPQQGSRYRLTLAVDASLQA